MALNTFKCKRLTPLHFKGLKQRITALVLVVLSADDNAQKNESVTRGIRLGRDRVGWSFEKCRPKASSAAEAGVGRLREHQGRVLCADGDRTIKEVPVLDDVVV